MWKKLIAILMVDSEGWRISEEEEIVDAVGTARELELEAEAEDVPELLRSHDKTVTNEEFLFMDEQRKCFLYMETTAGEDAMNIVEIKGKGLEYYINLVGKVAAGLEKIDFNFYKSSTVSKMLSASVACLL